MKVAEKISRKKDMYNEKSVTIAFLGDSVTQGCFECFTLSETKIETVFDYKSAYSTRLKEILNILYPKVQINIINSGISGGSAPNGYTRLERDVLPFKPDLCVVSFGLNDSMLGEEGIENYKKALRGIFGKLSEEGVEIIFLTQNTMCTNVSCHLTQQIMKDLASKINTIQNNKILKKYFDEAKSICKEFNVKVCDMYSVWERMENLGVDVTELLANKLNHPIREFHYYIAIKLIETMFEI